MRTVEEIKDLFFEGSTLGYAGGKLPKLPVPGLPGYKRCVHEKNGLRYSDVWCKNGEFSAGSTTILEIEGEVPLWFMSYGGRCGEIEAIPFLKRALLAAYEKREFIGGRGPQYFTEGSNPLPVEGQLIYHNNQTGRIRESRRAENCSFIEFYGKECIYVFEYPFDEEGFLEELSDPPKKESEYVLSDPARRQKGGHSIIVHPNEIFWHRYQGLLLFYPGK